MGDLIGLEAAAKNVWNERLDLLTRCLGGLLLHAFI